MKFTKMQGTGNDFPVIEDLENQLCGQESKLAIKLCDRRFGIGGDGVLIVRKSNVADIRMVIINADGSYAEMCGNGIRCFAKYVYEKGIVKKEVIDIETGDGVKTAFLDIEEGKVKGITIHMGNYSFEPKDFGGNTKDKIICKTINANGKDYVVTSMLMGVPHTVILGNLDDYDIQEGREIEVNDIFKNNTNVNFCEVIDENLVQVKTWERGAGPTLACGTGSCASVVCANYLDKVNSKVQVQVPGGELFIEVKEDGVLMTGPAEIVYEGEIEI